MARSLLGAFVSGARGMLSAQLFISVVAVALAGWTIAVTNQVMRERDLLRERVIQLEAAMAERGMVVPPTQTVETPVARRTTPYPGAVGAVALAARAPGQNAQEEGAAERDLGQMIGGLFGPAPPLRVAVLHVRAEHDAAAARAIAEELQQATSVHVLIDLMPPHETRPSGYTYFDGRQNRPAADLVTEFHDIARAAGIAPWSAQLRGAALPAQGEYTADRIDLVLPALPPPAPVAAPQRAG